MGRHLRTIEKKDKNLTTLKIVTYNILCPQYCSFYQFHYASRKSLVWENRKFKIISELLSYSSDIICLQEVDQYKWFKQQLGKFDFDSVYYRRTNQKCDGCATFYNKNKYKFIDKLTVNFNDVSKDPEYHTDNIGLICIFETIEEIPKRFCVINVHFYWDPSYENVKLGQSNFILEFIENNIPKDIGIILCGDFNSLPESNVYKNFDKNNFESVNKKLGEPEFTNYTKNFKGTLDYIFLNSKFKVHQILENVSIDKVQKEIALPNNFFASDHLAVYSEIILK
eukprot:gene1023-9927_t